MLDRFPDQASDEKTGRIHAERIEAKFPQTANQTAVTTANVEDSRARGRAAATAASKSVHHRRSQPYAETYLLPPPETSG